MPPASLISSTAASMPILMASPVWASAPVSSHDPAMQGSAFCALAGAIASEKTSAVPASSAGARDVERKKFQIIPASCLEFVERDRSGATRFFSLLSALGEGKFDT